MLNLGYGVLQGTSEEAIGWLVDDVSVIRVRMHKMSIACCRRRRMEKNEWKGMGVAGLYEGVRLDKLRAYTAEEIKYAGV